MRRSYYRDSYGRWHEDRQRHNRAGLPARFAVYALLVLAVLIVLTSLAHLRGAARAVMRKPSPGGVCTGKIRRRAGSGRV